MCLREIPIMPRKDTIHDAVKNALIKAGWTVTDDPYRLVYDDADVYIDLRIEKMDDMTQVRRAVVIEIKSFLGKSAIDNLENALGQYDLYRIYLSEIAPDERIYLAISSSVFDNLFSRGSFRIVVKKSPLSLVVVNIETEEVVEWIN